MEFSIDEKGNKKEFISNEVLITLCIMGSALASSYTYSSTVQMNPIGNKHSIEEEGFFIESNREQSKSEIMRLSFPENSKTKPLSTGVFYEKLLKVEADSISGYILSNKTINNLESYVQNRNESAIINNEGDVKKGVSAMQQLISHREFVEKVGVVSGIVLGSITLAPSLLSLIEWGATIPASLLFFSLSGFMLLRKRLRGVLDEC